MTSPDSAADGDYPINVSVQRVGSSDVASATNFYKVYSSDTIAPTMFWPSPGNGATITGRSFNISVSANDDHAVAKIELFLDGASKMVQNCGGVAFSCQLIYTWPVSVGQHTAVFKAYDFLGNMSTVTSTFTAN